MKETDLERWLPAPDVIVGVKTSDRYMVSNHGNMKRLPYVKHGRNKTGVFSFVTKEAYCKLSNSSDGYKVFSVKRDGVNNSIGVHRLVAFAFLGDPEKSDMQVNHIDGDKTNNHVDNLEWVTARDNVIHSYVNNLASNKCDRHPRSILTNDKVLQMRSMYRTGEYTYQDISDIFGIKYCTAWKILNNVNYRSLL